MAIHNDFSLLCWLRSSREIIRDFADIFLQQIQQMKLEKRQTLRSQNSLRLRWTVDTNSNRKPETRDQSHVEACVEVHFVLYSLTARCQWLYSAVSRSGISDYGHWTCLKWGIFSRNRLGLSVKFSEDINTTNKRVSKTGLQRGW